MDENLPATPGTYREDSFDVTVRGYNRQQVMEYMTKSSQLLATLEQHLAVARADVHRARSEAEQAQAEVARLRAEPVPAKPVHEEVSSRLSQILRLAAEEAAQERETAEAEIGKLHSESQAETKRLLSEARMVADRDLAQARDTAERELAEARAIAEQELTAAREEADRLRQASIRHAEGLLDNAQRRAGAVNEVSNQRLETLTATHGEAVLRLGQIRDVLADLLDRDAAAGSLAQVVEAVIAPVGSTPEQLNPGAEQTAVQQPVTGTAVQAAVSDGRDAGRHEYPTELADPTEPADSADQADSARPAGTVVEAPSRTSATVLAEPADDLDDAAAEADLDAQTPASPLSDQDDAPDRAIDLRDRSGRLAAGEASRR